MAKRFFVVVFVVLILATIAAGSVSAGSISIGGSVDPTDPTLLVAIISTPNCTGGYGSVNVHYDLIHFQVDAAGNYTVNVLSGTGNTAFYLLQGSINTGAVADTCIAASNSGNPQTVTEPLSPGIDYYVVIIDDTFAQAGDTYTLTISGPGNPLLGGSGDVCSLPIPAGSVVGEAPLGAHVYWAPGQESPGLVLNPGTYHVIGQDASETYYKLFFNCQYIWVRKDTMQPSWLPPQNGAPLPDRIVS
jgi:hypothetical protein